MTCLRMNGAIVCVSPWGRLKLGNRYVEVSYHEYCGPSFTWVKGDIPYEPADENDPIWPLFYVWLAKFEAEKAKRRAARPSPPREPH